MDKLRDETLPIGMKLSPFGMKLSPFIRRERQISRTKSRIIYNYSLRGELGEFRGLLTPHM